MIKEVILVPKDKCPLDFLAEMGEQTRNSWIFLHEFAYQNLNSSCDLMEHFESDRLDLKWDATADYPQTILRIYCKKYGSWILIDHIEAEDIAFEDMPEDPKSIFFLKMEE